MGMIQGAARMASFAPGGYTGDGSKYEPVPAMLHKGEYVVPQQGALVIRGDDSVVVLREILNVLKRIETKGGAGVAINVQSRSVRDAVNGSLDLYDRSFGGGKP
jgi:hypothetical protein